MSSSTNDPVSELLAREMSALAGLGDDFVAAPPPQTNNDFVSINENEQEEEEEMDEDECKDSPAYIPKQGRFYMHDEASARSVIVEHTSLFVEEAEKGEEGQSTGGTTQMDTAREPKTRADRVGRWKHDMFIEREQAPKSSREIFMRYGQDIRQQKGEEVDNQATER